MGMYKSPFEIIYGQIQMQMDGEIYRAVQSYDINVDERELRRALHYDRNQYLKGYADAMDDLVRCKDCKHALEQALRVDCPKLVCTKSVNWHAIEPEHFCSYGERKDNG